MMKNFLIGFLFFFPLLTFAQSTAKEFIKAGAQIRQYAVKHLGRTVKPNQLFTPEVFTPEVLEALDEKLRPIFELPDPTSNMMDDVNTILNIEDDEDEQDMEL